MPPSPAALPALHGPSCYLQLLLLLLSLPWLRLCFCTPRGAAVLPSALPQHCWWSGGPGYSKIPCAWCYSKAPRLGAGCWRLQRINPCSRRAQHCPVLCRTGGKDDGGIRRVQGKPCQPSSRKKKKTKNMVRCHEVGGSALTVCVLYRPLGPLPSLSRGVLTFSPFIQHGVKLGVATI